jgi:hypothetical protein
MLKRWLFDQQIGLGTSGVPSAHRGRTCAFDLMVGPKMSGTAPAWAASNPFDSLVFNRKLWPLIYNLHLHLHLHSRALLRQPTRGGRSAYFV